MQQKLLAAQELLQDDLITFLDGLPSDTVTHACGLVIERFKPLFDESSGMNE